MVKLLPYLIKKALDGSEEKIILNKYKLTFGRYSDNDVSLPENENDRCYISRRKHCVLERGIGEEWFLTDTSTNGTSLKPEGEQSEITLLKKQKVAIGNGDEILIHGYVLTFYDPNRTNRLPTKSTSPQKSSQPSFTTQPPDKTFIYNLSQTNLYKIAGQKRERVHLNPNASKMFNFMAKKNFDNNNQPILCTYEDLIKEVWGEKSFDCSEGDVQDLAKMIRDAFKKHDGSKTLLETKKKQGYILHIICEP